MSMPAVIVREKISFPNRVWEQTRKGWCSREPTRKDHLHRAALREAFETHTLHEHTKRQRAKDAAGP